MPEPISLAGTVVGLVSVGIQTTQSLVKFYTSYKSQDSALAGTVERLDSLSENFRQLEKALLDRNFQSEQRTLIKGIEISIKKCDGLIYELQEECQKFDKPSSGIVAAVRHAGRRATYPFRQSTLQKLDEDIGEIRYNLSSALDVLQLQDSKRNQDENAEAREFQTSSALRDWLNAPRARVNHDMACATRYSGTGMWLVKSPVFLRWLTEYNSILWLNGFAGSGKSVLCSKAIEVLQRRRASDLKVGIAFFYFTFNDHSKQGESGMLRALLLQLSSQHQDGEADLTKLYHSNKDCVPDSRVLIEYLRRLIQRFHQVYLVLDGIDECPRDGPREGVLDTLNDMRNWDIQALHLFVTSRDELDIRNSLDLRTEQQVAMRNTESNKDIASYVSARLNTDRKLLKWLPHREKIQEALTQRAEGVFRWVECQLRSLQSCPRSEDHLDCLLNSLPRSLDETYERMLCNINPDSAEDARRILTLLCFAARPLMVQELLDGLAVKISHPPGFNHRRRLQDFDDLNAICPGLIDIDLRTHHVAWSYREEDSMPTVQIAHFSVQEYLKSERIQHQKAAIFGLSSSTAHAEIAQICLVYLLERGLPSPMLGPIVSKEYPMAYFAALYWLHHYQNTINPTTRLDELILRLFQHQDSFENWIEVKDVDTYPGGSRKTLIRSNVAGPVYYASLLGFEQLLNELINTALVEHTNTPAVSLVNAQGGHLGNALEVASYNGHEKTVQLLLDKEADVNAQGGYYGNALQAASCKGHEKVVQLLLDKGADVNVQGGIRDGNALQAASSGGHEKVVQLLLNKGADVNAQGARRDGNALQAASSGGHEKVVQLLLDKGADVNAHDGHNDNALYAASCRGYENIVQLLLDKGADVNAESGYHDGSALQAASSQGHEKVVQLLLDKGADVNAHDGHNDNALYAASCRGYENIVQLLLDKGADVNAEIGYHDGSALQAASSGGHEKVVQLLLNKGADVNAQGGYCGNALQAASCKGHEKIVQLLLDKGADVNAQGARGDGNALQAASCKGHEKIVQLLLDKEADVNAQGARRDGNAVQAASSGGHEKVVQLLLDKGADVNAHDGHNDNALYAASCRGYENIVQLLLDKGAVVNARGGWYGNALQAASSGGYEKVAQLLLDKKADVNVQGGYYGNALQVASVKGHEKVVQLLLDNGADVNAQGGYYGNALQAASSKGHKKIVQLLLDKKADVNAQGGYYGNALQAASSKGHEKVVQLLLDKGAVVNARGGYYGNALQAASSEGHEKIVQLLLDKKADVNAQGGHYGNALHAALATGHEKVAQLLRNKGAVDAQGYLKEGEEGSEQSEAL